MYSFFLNQQFITQSIRADHGSYFVTTYKTTRLHDEREKRKKKKRRKIVMYFLFFIFLTSTIYYIGYEGRLQ